MTKFRINFGSNRPSCIRCRNTIYDSEVILMLDEYDNVRVAHQYCGTYAGADVKVE